ncbi:hypothetical protein [Hyphomonas sp.]|jgi:hypothetical protein|uniref:hypothetical protein n=1 Tax=Hyphomonas sp. TaxID=87 RepID=UPI0025C2BB85|nr:hypothetical protein [Hyphomonas sp.]
MTAWLLGTSREPARRLVRWVASIVVAAAFITSLWAAHIGVTLLTLFWALVLMGPMLAWPLTWGPLLGRGSLGIAVLLIILPGYLGNGHGATLGETVMMYGASIPFFLLGVVLSVPQLLIGLVQSLIRR